MLEVVAAILRHPHSGHLLLTLRPAHKVRGGCWEFPGGKIDAGESAQVALARELNEELGVRAQVGELRLVLRHQYPDLYVRLQVYEIMRWDGLLQALDVAGLHWLDLVQATDAPRGPIAVADQQILSRLVLAPIHAITPDCPDSSVAGQQAWLDRISVRLGDDPDLQCLIRAPSLEPDVLRRLLAQVLPLCRDPRKQLLISRDSALALELGLGLQLASSQLAQPPAGWDQVQGIRAASCHSTVELIRAQQLGCDWATLSPVLATASHPDAPALGWPLFQQLAEQSPLPVYALGGMAPALLQQARAHGAVGVAGISAFWGDKALT